MNGAVCAPILLHSGSVLFVFNSSRSLYRCVYLQGGPASVRFGYGSGVERFERFRFSVPAVPL